MRRTFGAVVVMVVAVTACGGRGDDAAIEAFGGRIEPPGVAAVAPAVRVQPGAFPGIFPFTSGEELDAYTASRDQTFRDPVQTARAFAVNYLGFTTPELADSGFQAGEPGAGEVSIGVRRGTELLVATTVVLRQLGEQGRTGPWTVVAATAPGIEVTSPGPLQRITSPVIVSGRAGAFEGTVNIEVREDRMPAGQSLGKGFVTATGQPGPFQGEIAFRPPSQTAGAVLFQDRSGGGVGETNAFATTVVRVLFVRLSLTG